MAGVMDEPPAQGPAGEASHEPGAGGAALCLSKGRSLSARRREGVVWTHQLFGTRE